MIFDNGAFFQWSRRGPTGARLSALLALFAIACGGSEFTSGGSGSGGADAGGVTSNGNGGSGSAGANGNGGGGANAGGVTGAGGSNGGGDLDGSDGSTVGHDEDAGSSDADASGVGGSDSGTDSGGSGASGGTPGSGGGSSSGGTPGSGGAHGSGGASGSGGAASGGSSSSGGVSGSGGAGSGGAGSGGACTTPTTWYPDNDHDGYGVTAAAVEACEAPTTGTWVTIGGDCLDDNPLVHPQDSANTVYYYTPYSVPGGGESYDYDCSGTETGDPSQAAYSSCTALSLGPCQGSGYSKTTRTTGDAYCGSAAYVTCSGTLVCSGSTKSLPADQAYRCH